MLTGDVEGAYRCDASAIDALQLSRLCDEFGPGVLPGQVLRELQTDPEQWAVQVMDLRAFSRTWLAMTASGAQDSEFPASEMNTRVRQQIAAWVKEGRG